MKKITFILFLLIIIIATLNSTGCTSNPTNQIPIIEKISGPGEMVNDDVQIFRWNGNDIDGTVLGYEYRKDQGNWAVTTNTEYIWNSINEGNHTFEVRAKDDDSDYSSTIIWYFEYNEQITNVDLMGPVYNGNILLINNESVDIRHSENTGDLGSTVAKHFDVDDYYKMHMIDANIPFYSSEDDELVNPEMCVEEYGLYDTKDFWTFNFMTYENTKINATLQYIGTNIEVWVEDADEITPLKAQQLGEEFDEVVWDIVTSNFYVPSDVNGDGRVAVLCFDIQDDFNETGIYYGGYFSLADLYDVSTSNHMEIFYIDTYPTMHNPKSAPVDFSNAYSILAHEFQHMVNYNRNVIEECGTGMPSWLNEAFSMAAEHIYEGVQNKRIEYYNNSDNIRNGRSILNWESGNDVLSNYALSYLMGQYIRVQMGQGDSIFRELLLDSDNDYLCVENAIHKYIDENLDFGRFMTYFRIALLLKESDGLFGFKGESGFDSINTKTTSNPPSSIIGGEAFFIDLDGNYIESGTKGPDIKYVGILSN